MIEDIRNKKFAIAFGGGGAKGVAHIGVIKFLEEHELRPIAVSGSSIGAFVAAMYAFGVSSDDMLKAFNTLEPFHWKAFKPGSLGIMENVSLMKVIGGYLSTNTVIENSSIPLTIHATDIVSGEGVSLDHGNLLEAVLASSCVPGIYVPKIIKGKMLVDGGLTENVPINCLNKHNPDLIMAINLNGVEKYNTPDSIMDIIKNSLDIAIDRQTKKQIEKADIVINLDLSEFSRIKVQNVDGIMEKMRSNLEEAFFK